MGLRQALTVLPAFSVQLDCFSQSVILLFGPASLGTRTATPLSHTVPSSPSSLRDV